MSGAPTIGFACESLGVGGIETFILSLGETLQKRHGYKARIVLAQACGAWMSLAADKGLEVRQCLPRLFESQLQHVRRLAKALDGCDVVLLNHCRLAQASLGLLRNRSRVAVCSVLHSDMEEFYRIGLANHSHLDSCVAVSSRIQREVLKRVGSGFGSVVRIHHGIHVPTEAPLRSESPVLRVVYAGRLKHRPKGVLDLPILLKQALEQKARLHLDLVGDGPDREVLLRKLTEMRGLDGFSFHYHGFLANQATREIVTRNDVLILPSHSEGFGIVLLEGLAGGAVPVASRIEGVTDEIVTDGQEGILCSPGAPADFAGALVSLHRDRGLLARMSYAGWSRARTEFTVEKMADEYARHFQELLREERRLDCRPSGVYTPLLDARYRYPRIALILRGRMKA